MIILLVPMHSKREINADSNYVLYSTLIPEILRQRPDWTFFILFPDAGSDYKYEDDGFFTAHRNVFRIPYRLSPRKQINAVTFDGVWWDTFCRTLPVNGVWNFLPEISGPIKMAGDNTFDETGRRWVISTHNYTVHRSLPYPWEGMRTLAIQQAVGSVLADWNIVNSHHTVGMVRDIQSEFLSDGALLEAESKTSLIPYGPVTPEMTYRANENPEPIIAYNHRLQGYKNWRVTFALLQELWDEGVRFKVRYMNNVAEKVSAIQGHPFVEVVLSATHREYLEKLAECDLNVMNSQHETFCISAVESMAFGQPLVAPDGVTFPEITGKKEIGYPFLFNSIDAQREMVRDLLTSAELRHQWGKKVSEFVHRTWGVERWASDHIALFERLEWERREGLKRGLREAEAALKVWKELKPLSPYGPSLSEVRAAIYGLRIEGRQPYSNQSMTDVRLLRFAQAFGGSVTVRKGELFFKAPEGG